MSRYIITREPLGSANKHLTDQTTLILNLQTDIKQIQVRLLQGCIIRLRSLTLDALQCTGNVVSLA